MGYVWIDFILLIVFRYSISSTLFLSIQYLIFFKLFHSISLRYIFNSIDQLWIYVQNQPVFVGYYTKSWPSINPVSVGSHTQLSSKLTDWCYKYIYIPTHTVLNLYWGEHPQHMEKQVRRTSCTYKWNKPNYTEINMYTIIFHLFKFQGGLKSGSNK